MEGVCNQVETTSATTANDSEKVVEESRTIRWSEVLASFREEQQHQTEVAPGDCCLYEKYREFFPSVHRQLSSYYDDRLLRLRRSSRARYRPTSKVTSATTGGTTTDDTDESTKKEDRKNLIVDTRNVLRFAMLCLSIPSSSSAEDDENNVCDRKLMQREAIRCEWDKPIARILCCRIGDEKCRLYASRVFCNMVTSNAETASSVVSWLQLTPSEETIARRILVGSSELQQQQQQQQQENDDDDDDDPFTATTTEEEDDDDEPNWLDMVLCSSRDRSGALSATLAAMHNTIASLDHDHSLPPNPKSSSFFATQVSSNSLLVSTLLRQTVSLESADMRNNKGDDHTTTRTAEAEAPSNFLSDEATEWIVLLVGRLCRLGNLPVMYNAIAGTGSTNDSSSTTAEIDYTVVLPEQLVLLHCVQAAITADGGSDVSSSWEVECLTYLSFFLVELYTNLRRRQVIANDDDNNNNKSSDDDDVDDDNDGGLRERTILIILEILAELVGSSSSSQLPSPSSEITTILEDDGDEETVIQTEGTGAVASTPAAAAAALLRVKIGQETNFIETIGRHAGELVDGIMKVYQNGKIVSGNDTNDDRWEDEGPVLIVLVRLFGYLCYHCRSNQDLVRTTEVPGPVQGQSDDHQPTSSAAAEGSATTTSSPPPPNHRSILHVLLSCTSLSFVCFPLREWSIVTLRLVLQDNLENQATVEALQAQQAVQTATLDEMGMDVQLDQYGKVKLTPKKEQEK